MKKMAIAAMCFPFLGGCAQPTSTDEWGKVVNGLQCSLSSSRRKVGAGRPGALVLKVRNVGHVPARYSVESCCGPTFKVRASFEDGASLHFVDVEQQEHPHGGIDWVSLQPGDVREHRYDVVVRKFGRSNSLYVGHELAAKLERRGELDLALELNGVVSNVVRIKVR